LISMTFRITDFPSHTMIRFQFPTSSHNLFSLSFLILMHSHNHLNLALNPLVSHLYAALSGSRFHFSREV
jgi:hypothetical protein